MSNQTAKKFSFTSSALPADTFAVTHFKGTEGLSQCYEFEINLVSENLSVDMDDVLAHPAIFTIRRDEGDIRFNGILMSFDQLHHFNQYAFYRVVLVPRLKWLTMIHHNQVFLNQKPHEVISTLLKDGGLTSHDFDMRLQWEADYPVKEYTCQYNESHFDFFDRWMRRMGFYYYFEQLDDREKLIITDTKIAHTEMTEGKVIYYSEPSGLPSSRADETVHRFRCSQRLLPQKLQIKAYDYLKPSFPIIGDSEITEQGRGTVYLYTEHKIRQEDMAHITKIRAEQYACLKRTCSGTSTVPFLRPGYLFELKGHYRPDFNREYMTVELAHEGHQVGYLTSGVRDTLSDLEKEPEYRNSFHALPADVQFRPDIKESYIRIYGTMHATVDAEGSGTYAELDEHGRYKILLPFDLAGRKGGKSSAWIRMIQPYAGEQHGMHFPLHKGTEVILVFTNGDPDLPMIAGAIPNPEHPSMVTGLNQTMSIIQTGGQNKIAMEDKVGSESILMKTPTANSFIRIGAPTDSDEHEAQKEKEAKEKFIKEHGEAVKEIIEEEKKKEEQKEKEEEEAKKWKPEWPGDDTSETGQQTEDSWGIHLFTHKLLDIKAETKNEIILGSNAEMIGGAAIDIVVGGRLDVTAGIAEDIGLINRNDFTGGIATDIVIGAKIDALLGGEVSFTNFKMNVVETEMKAMGHEVKALADELKATGKEVNIIGDATEALVAKTSAIGSTLDSHATTIKACITKTEALTTGLQTVGTCVDNIGTVVSTRGLTNETIGTAISNAGTVIKNSATDITNAPIIMHN